MGLAAVPGDVLQIGGPRGSAVLTDDFDWYLLIGDETALPAIARRLDELRSDIPVIVLAMVDAPDDRVALPGRQGLSVKWIERRYRSGQVTRAGDKELLLGAVAGVALPPGDGYVWIAAEAGVARAVRSHVVDDMGHPRAWTKAAGYWSAGDPGAHQRIDD